MSCIHPVFHNGFGLGYQQVVIFLGLLMVAGNEGTPSDGASGILWLFIQILHFEEMDEVVVVGYGTMKKSDLTGAVSSVGVKDIKDSPVANIGQAMQGKVSGVQIIDAGKPGDNVTIKIRGLGTINNSNPLIVIDGIPTDLGLSSLNMADVERVDVLKDASATADRKSVV